MYLLRSTAKGLVKIGVAETSLDQRLRQLCSEKYAGANDWEVVRAESIANAGTLESIAHARLAAFACPVTYVKNKREQRAKEVYSCDLETALAAFDEAIKAHSTR
jgi:hypothetical protein